MTAAAARAAPRATVITHGCRSNLAEQDAIAALAPAGSTVINSCAVTAAAVRDARAAARRAARAGPVYVTGCAAEIAPDRFRDLAILVPNAAKRDPAAWGRADDARPPAVTRQSRGFVAIQDGCDHACTFCVTRLARGPSRSVPLEALVEAVQALADAGVAEVVLTGIDATSWGGDLLGRPPLGQLVQALLARTAVGRLRLSSLDAAEADPALIEALAEPRVMPHLHLSLQSGDDLVLKRMRRRHSRADALALAERVRRVRPDVALGADLIAGFPTEGAANHAASLALIAELGLAHAHVFPFSPRPGTAAARMPQLPPGVARARAAELRAAAARQTAAFAAPLLGQAQPCVSEGPHGLTPHGFRMRFAAQRPRGAVAVATAARFEDGQFLE